MKKNIRSAISLVLLLGVLITSAATAQAVQLRYIGISQVYSSLEIDSAGAASCGGDVEVRSGYTVDLKVELKQDGVTIKTWTDSGSGNVTAGGTHYVKTGHNYIVKTTATVYDGAMRIVESPYKYSESWFY